MLTTGTTRTQQWYRLGDCLHWIDYWNLNCFPNWEIRKKNKLSGSYLPMLLSWQSNAMFLFILDIVENDWVFTCESYGRLLRVREVKLRLGLVLLQLIFWRSFFFIIGAQGFDAPDKLVWAVICGLGMCCGGFDLILKEPKLAEIIIWTNKCREKTYDDTCIIHWWY